jgi:pentatricopeptide repeat protein
VQLIRSLLACGDVDEAMRVLDLMRARFPASVHVDVAASLVELQRPDLLRRLLEKLDSRGAMVVVVVASLLLGGVVVLVVVVAAGFLVRRRAAARAQIAVERALAQEPASYRLSAMLADLLEEQGRVLAALELRVRIGMLDPRPELVDKVIRTSRRALVVGVCTTYLLGAISAAAAVNAVAEGEISASVASPVAVLVLVLLTLAARRGIERLYRKLPHQLVDRVRAPLLPYGRVARALVAGAASICLLAVVPAWAGVALSPEVRLVLASASATTLVAIWVEWMISLRCRRGSARS